MKTVRFALVLATMLILQFFPFSQTIGEQTRAYQAHIPEDYSVEPLYCDCFYRVKVDGHWKIGPSGGKIWQAEHTARVTLPCPTNIFFINKIWIA